MRVVIRGVLERRLGEMYNKDLWAPPHHYRSLFSLIACAPDIKDLALMTRYVTWGLDGPSAAPDHLPLKNKAGWITVFLWRAPIRMLFPCSVQVASHLAPSSFFCLLLKLLIIRQWRPVGLHDSRITDSDSLCGPLCLWQWWNIPEERRGGRKRGTDLTWHVMPCENQGGIPASLNQQNCNCSCLLICLMCFLAQFWSSRPPPQCSLCLLNTLPRTFGHISRDRGGFETIWRRHGS